MPEPDDELRAAVAKIVEREVANVPTRYHEVDIVTAEQFVKSAATRWQG